jgi:cation diffusion facilitator family transporter
MKKTERFAYEIRIIKLSIIVTFFVSITGVLAAWYTQSISVLIDAIYTMVAFFVYIFALYSTKKINQPADNVYQYGYFKFEPVAVIVQSLLLFSIVIFAVILALMRIFQAKVEVKYGFASAYTSLVVIVCFIMYFITRRCARKSGSSIIAADTQIWLSDAWLSVGVLVGFAITYLANAAGFTRVPQYADPVITLLIVVLIVREPFKLLSVSLHELLDANAGKRHHRTIKKIVMQNLSFYPQIRLSRVKITKAGRKLFVDVKYLLPSILKTDELQELNAKIRNELQNKFPFIEINFVI